MKFCVRSNIFVRVRSIGYYIDGMSLADCETLSPKVSCMMVSKH